MAGCRQHEVHSAGQSRRETGTDRRHLLIDKEKSIWHLTNGSPVTWAELALMAAHVAGVDTRPNSKLTL
jgi:hypothetical protein